MTKNDKNAVTVQDDKPSYLKKFEEAGPVKDRSNFDSSDIVIPRIKLLQGLSKECETFDSAKAGMFWHTGMDVSLGSDIDFVICGRKKKLLLVAPIEDGQGLLARAEDCKTWDRLGEWEVKIKDRKEPVKWSIGDLDVQKSGLANWGTYNPDDENSPPAATLFYDYLVLVPDHLDLGPAVISLARSQIRKAKKGLNDKAELHMNNGRPLQAVVFHATSVGDQNSVGQSFKNWQFTGAGFASEALYNRAVELEPLMQTLTVQNEASAAMDEAEGEKVDTGDKF